MTTLAFDTHAHVKRLVSLGMSEGQAEAVVEAVKDTTALPDISELATRAELKALKAELIWWIIGTGVVFTVAHLFIK